jgi:DNA segregation ATPase FtsK/SpoIIIE-like protein
MAARKASKKKGKKRTAKKSTRRKASTEPGAFAGSLSALGSRMRQFLSVFALGAEVEEDTSQRLQEMKGLGLAGLSLLLLISLATYHHPFQDPLLGIEGGNNWGGQAGYYLAHQVYTAFGWAGYLLVFLGGCWGMILVTRHTVALPTLRLFGGVAFLASTALLLELAFGTSHPPSNDLPYGPGGWLAGQLVGSGGGEETVSGLPILIEKFGTPGTWILALLTTVIAFMLATEMAFYPALSALREWIEVRREERGESAVAALVGYSGRLFTGLWSFLRGAGLEAEPTNATRGRAKTIAARKRKAKAAKSKKNSKSSASAALFDEEQDELAGLSGEEEEEEEWEYEDEAEEEPEAEGAWAEGEEEDADGEWEWEYGEEGEEEPEEGEEEEWEWEEEDEPIEVIKPLSRKEKTAAKKTAKERAAAEAAEEQAAAKAAAKELGAKKRAAKQAVAAQMKATPFEPPTPPAGPWKFPPLDLLTAPAGTAREDEATLENQAKRLENALASFRVGASVVGAQVGPAVTMFELEVTEGTRMNRVTQLAWEIAAALKARSVRIIAPIPGRSTIGIEVPNKRRRVVRLSELFNDRAYDKTHMALPLFLGMDAEGESVITDLARMPHLLIAGTTGSGKSVCISTVLLSLLMTRSPHDVQLILVDPKMVELQLFANVPHLMLPVVTDMKQAVNVLLWAVEKMEGRYELFKDAGVRNIATYNKLGEEGLRERLGDNFHEERTPRQVPYIVMVIDEMADLMMTSKKEAEGSITRLAQKSRAVGIHVVVATQRPSTDVITGVLKGNLPTRIAFQVASKIDSRVILDVSGGEKLLGEGDMLFMPPQTSQLLRVQGAFVEDDEIKAIVDFVSQESAPTFSQELIQSATGAHRPGQGGERSGAEQDALWDDAVRVILKSKRGSASLLQRALGVGYTRASRLIDLMTAEGIVGEHKGSKAREILLSLEDWEEMHGAPAGQGISDE